MSASLQPQPHEWFVEETLPNGAYQVIAIGTDLDDAIRLMNEADTMNRLEVWSKLWAECDHGFAPMAWRNERPNLN